MKMISKDLTKDEPSAQLIELPIQSRFDLDNPFSVTMTSDSDMLSVDILKLIGKRVIKFDQSDVDCPDRINMKQIVKALSVKSHQLITDISLSQVKMSARVSPYK